MFKKETPITVEPPSTEINLEGPIVLDLGRVKDEPVEKGWHAVRIERAEPKLSRQKRLPCLFVLSRITDEADPDFNRTIIWNVMLAGDGMVFTKRCFKAFGMPEVLEYPSYQHLAEDLIGREAEVKVRTKVYEGQRSVEANNWRPISLDIAF